MFSIFGKCSYYDSALLFIFFNTTQQLYDKAKEDIDNMDDAENLEDATKILRGIMLSVQEERKKLNGIHSSRGTEVSTACTVFLK